MHDPHRRVRAAAITGMGQLLGLVGSVLIGVLVAGTLPPSPRVDGFFAANQVYALALYLGQAVRVTAPALMVRYGLSAADLRRATGLMTVATVAVIAGAALIGSGAVAAPSRSSFGRDLLLLAPAAGLHVASGGIAARLSVVGSFGYAAAAYAAGSVVSGLLLLVTIGPYGPSALAPCLLAGATAVGVIMVIGYFRRLGFHWLTRSMPATWVSNQAARRESLPSALAPMPVDGVAAAGIVEPALMRAGGGGGGGVDLTAAIAPAAAPVPVSGAHDAGVSFALRRIGLGAMPALSLQLLITVVTVAAGHVVAGGTALLSYAFLALFAFTTIAITPMSIVLGPEMAHRWDGVSSNLAGIIRRATQLAVVIATPLVAIGFLIGRPVAGLLLGALGPDDLDTVFTLLAILAPSLLFAAAATAATVAITTADRLGALASGLLVVALTAVAAGISIAQFDIPLIWTAVIASTLSMAGSIVTLWVALGRRTPALLGRLLTENLPIVAPSMALTAFAATAGGGTTVATGALWAIAALGLHASMVMWLRRDVVELLAGAWRGRRA